MPDIDTCPRCNGRVRLDRDAPPPHHGKLVCDTCGRFCGWARAPMDAERAAGWVMPFGQHVGKTLAEINVINRDYLWWLVENIDKASIQHVVSYFLDSTSETTPCKPTTFDPVPHRSAT